jgi:hypothetical protein
MKSNKIYIFRVFSPPALGTPKLRIKLCSVAPCGIGSSFPAGVRTVVKGLTVQVGAGRVAVGFPGDGLVAVSR